MEQRAAEDELFAERYRNPNKDMDGCVTYISIGKEQYKMVFPTVDLRMLPELDEDEIEVGEPISLLAGGELRPPSRGSEAQGSGTLPKRGVPTLERAQQAESRHQPRNQQD